MKACYKFLIIVASILAAGSSLNMSALAQSQKTDIRPNAYRVQGQALVENFKGRTHEGAYGFSREGKPSRYYTETHHADGRTTYFDNGETDTGVWLIVENKLCFIYDSSELAGGCFRVYRVKNCFYFYSDDIIEQSDELDRDYWTARSVKKGETPQCQAEMS